MIFKRMIALWVLLVLSLSWATAQEAIELVEDIEQGGVSLSYPETWTHFIDPNGAIILSNGDLASITTGGEIGEDVIFMQVIVAGNNLIVFPEDVETIDAEVIMTQLAPPDANLTIETIEREDASALAFVDQSEGDEEGFVYVVQIDEETFGLIITSGATGQVSAVEEVILAIIDSIAVDFAVEVSEDDVTRYDIYEQSTSEAGFPMLGDPDAPISVVEVSSFDCPACGFFYNQILPLILERVETGDVNFQYVSVFGTGGIPAGNAAALAAYCAGEQDAFWAYHGLLFDWQQFGQLAFNGTRLVNGAEALGLDTEAFSVCLESEEAAASLTLTRAFADGLGEDYRGTPTVLINGQRVNNSAEEIVALLDSLLEEGE